MNLKQQIIIKYLNGDGQRKISKDLHTSRNTIRKYINEYNSKKNELLKNDNLKNNNQIIDDIVAEPAYDSSNRTRRKISDNCIELINQCLIENKQKRASGKAKQQMKAIDIYEFLKNKNFDISYSTVSNIVRSSKNILNEAYIKQEYAPGNICEFDWGEVKLNINNFGVKKYQLAGFPTTTVLGSTFFVTTAPEPTTAFSSIVTPGLIIALAPIHAPFFTRTGLHLTIILFFK